MLVACLAFLLFQPSGGRWAWLLEIRWLYVFVFAGVLSYLFTPITIILARRFNILDRPDFQRKIHSVPMPRIGGLAIFTAVMMAIFRNFVFSPQLFGLVLGSAMIYIVSFIDDISPLSAILRLIVQITASIVVTSSGVVMHFFPASWPMKEVLDFCLTIVWMVGITNAVNIMDGVDGLAASLVAVSALFFFFIVWPSRQNIETYITMALAGACLGFLPYNWKPAQTFLGDSGAMFIGFFIAGLTVMGNWGHNNPMVSFATPLLILGIPIFDFIYITFSRIKNNRIHNVKEWLEYTGKDHLHHRLMHLKFSSVETVLFIILINICLGLGALVMQESDAEGCFFMLLQETTIFLIIIFLMFKGRTVEPDEFDQ